uniref:(California timema) hypothetical protein n=1 Tax=Timema californicum TaxID=61474 RepID=A0A7R9JBU6_TIMCA|nr:unnamed protein product [Timema californicum]
MNCQRSLLITKNAAFYHHSNLVMKGLVTQSLVWPQWQGGTGYNNPIIPKNKSTVAFVPSEPEVGFVKRIMKRAGWFNTSKTVTVEQLNTSALANYATEAEFKLPDTFLSWFLVTELHVWMMLVRLMAEGKDGRFTRNIVVEAMWSDTNTRAKKLGVAATQLAPNLPPKYTTVPRKTGYRML